MRFIHVTLNNILRNLRARGCVDFMADEKNAISKTSIREVFPDGWRFFAETT